MSVETDIYGRLSAYTGLTDLVIDKIYPMTIPQQVALPAISFFKVSDVPEHAMGGDADIRTIRMQVSIWADTYSEAKAIEAQVVAALSRYRGDSNMKDIFLDNRNDFYENETHHVALDFIVYYAEA